jgi:hypothetical protein
MSCNRFIIAAAVALCVGVTPAVASLQTAVSCGTSNPNAPVTDSLSRGFYVAAFPATVLATVEVTYYAPVPGEYTITLRAAHGTFDGNVIGTHTQVLSFPTANLATAVVFDFQGAPVTQGETVAFSQTSLGPGENELTYDVGTGAVGTAAGSGPCAITETADFTPPLSTDRRNTVGATITTTSPGACVTSANTLCISDAPGDNRFQVTTSFATSQDGGLSGNATGISLAGQGVTEGGLF